MVSRAGPQVYGEYGEPSNSSRWSSEPDADSQEDDDLAIASRIEESLRKRPTHAPPPQAMIPVRTDYGPSSAQMFIEDSIELARADGRPVTEKNDKIQVTSQRILRPRPTRSQDNDQPNLEDFNNSPEDAASRGISFSLRRRLRRRPRQTDPSTDVDLNENDQTPVKSKSKKVKAAEKGLQRGANATTPLLPLLDRLTSLVDVPSSIRRSKSTAPSGMSESEENVLLSVPSGYGRKSLSSASETNDKEDIFALPQKATNLTSVPANVSTMQPNGVIVDTSASSQAQTPVLRTDLEAFQERERRQFALGLSVDTSQDNMQTEQAEKRRSSRNDDFEQESSARRQSWRQEENSSLKKRQSGIAGDIEEDSPRVRKPPSRLTVFPVSTEANLVPADRNNSDSSSGFQLQPPATNLSTLVDGLREDILAAAPSVPPALSSTSLNILDSNRSSGGRGVLSFGLEHAADNRDGVQDSMERRNPIGRKSSSQVSTSRQHDKHCSVSKRPTTIPNSPPFDYGSIVPVKLPKEMFETKRRASKAKSADDGPDQKTLPSSFSAAAKAAKAEPQIADKELPRVWDPVGLPVRRNDPPMSPLGALGLGWLDGEARSSDILNEICEFLSHQDVRHLRLVSRAFAEVVTPILFRSVVTNFGRSMFDVNMSKYDRKSNGSSKESPFQKFGPHMNKFGISFEVDLRRMEDAEPKIISKQEKGWFGVYNWPVPEYPRFQELQSMEDLVDNNTPLLRDAMKHLTNASELALSIDSGHGWLTGPDLSDLAVFRMRRDGGTPAFGKNFKGENKWHEHIINLLMQWAQRNTLNLVVEDIHYDLRDRFSERSFARSLIIRNYESFRVGVAGIDFDEHQHTGHRPSSNPTVHVPAPNLALALAQAGLPPMLPPTAQNQQQGVAAVQHQNHLAPASARSMASRAAEAVRDARRNLGTKPKGEKVFPQWPIIFNGHNLAAQVGGSCHFVQKKVNPPHLYPLLPGNLTEVQAQWLMETMWAQRGFLSAYTTAIIMNKANLSTVHSLHIAKLSSGLLPSLAQREFWSSLRSLKTLTILISPDWRREHIPGDRAFGFNMAIKPVSASIKFAEFLSQHIARLENLSALTIGFVGGGEHAPGMRARNQNVLPAPVTTDPMRWMSDHSGTPDMGTMMKFDHIQTLTFKNCWFSPCMLAGFMAKSVDTSLRHLILDSVSLTGVHHVIRNDAIMACSTDMRIQHGKQAWLQENLPYDGCWSTVLDRLTPGTTFFERKVAAGMIDSEQAGRPENQRQFRGNVEKITLKSCGYAKISGISAPESNQHGLVISNGENMVDEGIRSRKAMLDWDERLSGPSDRRPARGNLNPLGIIAVRARRLSRAEELKEQPRRRIMQSRKDPNTNAEYFGLGTLTQVVAPVEKRILEQSWGMNFGWGTDIERWAAVEDGFYEGGTGRFSGVITKEVEDDS